MIKYETETRLSEPIQALMELHHKDEAALRLILDLVQQHVVNHFGYHDINALRTALYRFPDDPVVQDAFYVKHNKTTQGLVNEGEQAIDVPLYTADGRSTTLFTEMPLNQPLVVIAGSMS